MPHDVDTALDVRLWDRLLELYVMTPMQALTADLLQPEGDRDAHSVTRARKGLSQAYAFTDRHLESSEEGRDEGRTWIIAATFDMLHCAAAPALFHAVTNWPLALQHRHLAAYFDRLM